MNFENLIDYVNELAELYVNDNMEQLNASDLGLDIRAGYSLWVNHDCIAVRTHNAKALDYYGGFEYVNETYTLGEYKFYSAESDRVQDCIDEWTHQSEVNTNNNIEESIES